MQVSGQSHTLATLYPGRAHKYATNRVLGGPRAWLDILEKEINLLPLLGFEPQIVQHTG